MPRWAKVAVWVVVFGACAGAGAYVAAHTNPFPPGVEDPGARPPERSSASTVTPTTSPQAWKGTFVAVTRHLLHVGGTCTSDWHATFTLRTVADGSIGGTGVARLDPGTGRCPFATAQMQVKAVWLRVEANLANASMRLGFSETSRQPVGSVDLGGFLPTIGSIRPALTGSGALAGNLRTTKPDGDLGRWVATYRFRVACEGACG